MENNIYQFPKIMGILNATPDSFSDGKNERIGKNSTEFLYQKAVEMMEKLQVKNEVSSILLFTDGIANRGVTKL